MQNLNTFNKNSCKVNDRPAKHSSLTSEVNEEALQVEIQHSSRLPVKLYKIPVSQGIALLGLMGHEGASEESLF